MRSSEFALAVFASLMGAALMIDSITLRQSAWLEHLGLEFDLPLHSSLAWSTGTAVACGAVHAVSATRASEGVPLMVFLLLLHTATYVLNALDPPPAGRQRLLAFSIRHGVATLAALTLAFVYKTGRTLIKFTRWKRLLKRVERQAQEQADDEENDEAAATRPVKRQPSAKPGPVLLLFANVGSGHKRAAEAIHAAMLARGSSADEVKMLDAMELVPTGFRWMMQVCFQELTQSLAGQHVLGYLYDAADHGRAKARFQRAIEDLCMLSLIEKVSELRPSAIVCTHFLPAQLFAGIRNRSPVLKRQLPLGVVLTDLDLQYMWVHKVDHYFVPRDDARRVLRAYEAQGTELLENTQVSITGIPIMPAFSVAAAEVAAEAAAEAAGTSSEDTAGAAVTRATCLRTFGLESPSADPRPVVVLISSGKQLVTAAYTELLKCSTPLRVLVVMGRQANIKSEIEALPVPQRHLRVVQGFVKDMPSLYRCADVLVSKSGGLTIAEAAALGVPMVILDPIPGQEQRNADVLLEAGAALKINDLPLLSTRVDEILTGDKRQMMSAAIRALGRPDAAFTVADAVLRKQLRPAAKAKAA